MKRHGTHFPSVLRSLVLVLLALLFFSPTVSADTCVECHTNLEKLKKLAPSKPKPAKKVSHGEG